MRDVVDLRVCGHVEYVDALRAFRLHTEVLRKKSDADALLLVEHPPVYTLGRGSDPRDVLLPEKELRRLGIEIHEADRGGEVTYHGPGQLVAYPLVDLNPDRKDVRRFVTDLEEVMIQTCAANGVTAQRIDKLRGIWVRDAAGDRKIGAVGVHLSHWISTHGLALNVTTDLSHFQHIVPCGIRDKGVTSLAAEGVQTTWREVGVQLADAFANVFGVRMRRVTPELHTVQVVPVREDGKILCIRRTMARGGFWQTVTGRVEKAEAFDVAAARELREETGANAAVVSLDYEHDFPLDPGITRRDITTVKWARENAYMAVLPLDFVPKLSTREHDAFEWLDADAAHKRLPYEGLKVAVRKALEKLPAK